MKPGDNRPIVIKRVRRAAAAHHGGAWKIAYADFVTAMMAFFLLMWLLGSTTRGDLQGIADYFRTPLKVALSGGNGSGDRTSPISAGGRDLTRMDELQMRRGGMPDSRRRMTSREAQAEVSREENIKLKALKGRLDEVIAADKLLSQYRNQLLIDITSE